MTESSSGPALRPISLYIHVPFCTVKCAYCDFNSYANAEEQIPGWEAALLEELRRWAPVVRNRPVATVFVGGGTPSLLEVGSVERIMNAIADGYALASDAEITMEANPESTRLERLRGYRASGVNRLSIGVQSLDPDELKFLDRLHDVNGAREAVSSARRAGFDNVSVDLIYGLPNQSLATWQTSLNGALDWGPDHISCYALTVEEETPLASRVASGNVREIDPDVAAEMTDWTEERLAAAGYGQYEISNYAKPGRECQHNLVYWRHGEYVGLGPGAHGFVDGVRYSVDRSPGRYIGTLKRSGGSHGQPSPAVVAVEIVDDGTAALDATVMGLRLNAGIEPAEFARMYGAAWDRFATALTWAEGADLLEKDGTRLRLTRRGRRLANEVFVRLMEPELV